MASPGLDRLIPILDWTRYWKYLLYFLILIHRHICSPRHRICGGTQTEHETMAETDQIPWSWNQAGIKWPHNIEWTWKIKIRNIFSFTCNKKYIITTGLIHVHLNSLRHDSSQLVYARQDVAEACLAHYIDSCSVGLNISLLLLNWLEISWTTTNLKLVCTNTLLIQYVTSYHTCGIILENTTDVNGPSPFSAEPLTSTVDLITILIRSHILWFRKWVLIKLIFHNLQQIQ